MKLQRPIAVALSTIFAALSFALAVPGSAFAHVTVKPGEVATATYQVFTVSVPNEKNIPTVAVKVEMPAAIASVTPTSKTGWKVTIERDGNDENAVVTAITWSGGEIAVGLRDEFTFSAKTPNEDTELKWKAYQTYSDGTAVSWDKEDEGDNHGKDSNSGPLSVTNVTKDAEAEDSSNSNDAKVAADRAMYVAVAGVVLGLVSVFLATRKK